MTGDPFIAGSVAALEAFRDELVAHRGRIENEDEPVFDVILDLLERVLLPLKGSTE